MKEGCTSAQDTRQVRRSDSTDCQDGSIMSGRPTTSRSSLHRTLAVPVGSVYWNQIWRSNIFSCPQFSHQAGHGVAGLRSVSATFTHKSTTDSLSTTPPLVLLYIYCARSLYGSGNAGCFIVTVEYLKALIVGIIVSQNIVLLLSRNLFCYKEPRKD